VEILITLVILAGALLVAVALPVVSYTRATRAERTSRLLAAELASLRVAVDALRVQAGAGPVDSRETAAAPAVPADAAVWRETESVLEHALAAPRPAAPAPADASGADGMPVTPIAGAQAAPAASLEQRIGAQWLLYVGIAALILGISYFIKFAFDNGWVSEPLRVTIGLAAGGALVVGGLRFARQGLALFGHVLAGGGIVVLYLATYAALHVYDLVGPTTAFLTMAAITGLSAWLAHRERAQSLALLAVIGGFATPVLVGGDHDSQRVLFTYVAILVAGTTTLALRHAWPWLHLVSYLLTGLTVVIWSGLHYTPAAWLRTFLFLTLFAGMFGVVIALLRRQSAGEAVTAGSESPPYLDQGRPGLVAQIVSWVLMTAPLAYHAASIAILAPHPGPLLVYLVLFSVAGLSISHHARAPWLRSLVLVLAALPLIGWMSGLRRPGWYPATLVTACALYALHLAGQWRAMSDEGAPDEVPVAEAVHAHLTGLFLPVALYEFFDTRAAWWNPPMLTALAAWNGVIALVTWPRVQPLAWQYAALAATLTAVAIGVWFDGPAVAVGWAMEAAALAWLARSRGSRWLGAGSCVLFVLGALRLAEMLARPLPVQSWPVVNTRALAALLVVGAAAWVARLLRHADAPDATVARDLLIVGANVLAVAWLSAEIVALFRMRAYEASAGGLPVGVAQAQLSAQVALSVAWALYAVGLVAVGFVRRYAPARYLAIALFGVTVIKVVTQDIAQLDRVYQMLSVLGVGALLVLASYLYQRTQRSPAT
jgi:uncharacterized membrane protein